MTETYLGNGIVSQSCYDPNTLRVTAIRAYPGAAQSCVVTDPANARLNLKYQQYDNAGNIQQVNDATRTETLTYTYDELDRLLSVSGAYSRVSRTLPLGTSSPKGVWLIPTAHRARVARRGR